MAWVRDKEADVGRKGDLQWEGFEKLPSSNAIGSIRCELVVELLYDKFHNCFTTNRQQIKRMEYDPWVLRREWKSS